MDEAPQVIPYAGTVSPKAGLTPGIILAVFAVLCAAVEYMKSADLAEMLTRGTDMPAPTGVMVATQHLHVGFVGCLLAGAALLLAKRPPGSLVVAGAASFQAGVLVPLLQFLHLADTLGKAPLAELIGRVASSMLAWAAVMASAWLVCRLAFESSRALRSDGPDWAAVRRTCAWSILLYAGCWGLSLAIAGLRFGSNLRSPWWFYAVPLGIAAALLVVGGVGGVLRQRWAWWLCTTTAAAWAICPIVAFFLSQSNLAVVWLLLRRMSIELIGYTLAEAPLAALWMMVLCHPQVRGRWTAPA